MRSWEATRATVLARDDYICRYCDDPAEHVDHVRPRADGGSDELWNLVAACARCNLTKASKIMDWLPTWEREVFDHLAAVDEAERLSQEIAAECRDC